MIITASRRSLARSICKRLRRRRLIVSQRDCEEFSKEGGERVVKTKEYSPPLDEGIKHEVEILAEGGIETYESCEGGIGHSYPEPTVRFHGHREEGFKALAIALQNGLKPSNLRRLWTIVDGEPVGPDWEMAFTHFDK
jgi:hypothetical protein